ncbi:ATP-binding protein [Paludisphaera borealis]|uniref:ATP-binding response regulator n=1 Tax=Paludisphaera borealis TaxID=1387353 RepID=UPI001F3DA7CF|nr:ATP-binding protein [Paludisphaera borealis]
MLRSRRASSATSIRTTGRLCHDTPLTSEEHVVEPEATVLLVDHNDADRARFRSILSHGGYAVFETSRGEDVVLKARDVRPHLIVLDAALPDLDVTAACQAIRCDGAIAGTPVLILTVGHDDSGVLAGLNAGADDYTTKDSAPELILARVRRLVQYRKLSDLAVLDRQLVQVGRLLAGIVHEIRGPLSVIRGSAELLRLSLHDRDDDLQWVDSILRGSSLLQLRLEHLMAAVRPGPVHLQPVDVGSLLAEAVDLFTKGLPPNQRQVRVETRCGHLHEIHGDAGRLMQVLFDLLSNAHQAIAASGKEGGILLRTDSVHEGQTEWVRMEVLDEGPGIPDNYLRRIFEPFFTTREGGSGYGLYLASEIVRELGGRLTARNNPGGGACFTVLLPARSAVAGSASAGR